MNYRANIAALKQLGATDVLSISVVGGLREDLPPGTFVIVDQFIDRTHQRDKSFFGRGLVAHVSMAHPVCSRLGGHLEAALRSQALAHARGSAYVAIAIRDMWLRGAPLIGAAAACGYTLAARADASDAALARTPEHLRAAARPTAVNLAWALERLHARVQRAPMAERAAAAWREADALCEEDVAVNAAIGCHGLPLLHAIAARKPGPVHVLTHCNAGWLAGHS